MIRDPSPSSRCRIPLFAEAEIRNHLGDITCKGSDLRRFCGIDRVLPKHKAVVFHHGAATGGIDYDGVETVGQKLAFPSVDIGAREIKRRTLLPEMVDESAAASAFLCDDDFSTVAGQNPDRRLIDLRCQNSLRAAGQKGYPHPPHALGRKDVRPICRRSGRNYIWDKCKQSSETARQKPSQRSRKSCGAEGQPEQQRSG
jgi:hypothetical protein